MHTPASRDALASSHQHRARPGRWFAAIGAVLLAAGPFPMESAKAAHPTYETIDLGDPTGLLSSYASDINDSGHVIVNGSPVYSWSPSDGFVDIGNLGAEPVVGRDINASGQIVGDSSLSPTDPSTRAFIWTPGGTMEDLGTLGGRHSSALAINDNGLVVGFAETASNETHAFSWTAGGPMVDLGTPGVQSGAVDVNNSGDIVVRRFTSPTTSFVLRGGVEVDLQDLGGGETGATVINSSGAVAGDSTTASGDRHPVLWTQAGGMVDLGSFGGTFGTVTAINDAGQVAGRGEIANGDEIAFFWSQSSGVVHLPTFGGYETRPAAMNESGQVVGYGVLPQPNPDHAFLWTLADGMIDLGVEYAYGINESGQIAASVVRPGLRRAALLQPVVADVNGNGIEDVLEVIGLPGAFADDNAPDPTFGSIESANGNVVTVADAPAPDGVRITVTGPVPADKATFSVCGMTLKLAPGSDVIVTCGSLTVTVVAGAAEVVVGDGLVVVMVPQGATAKISDLGDGSYFVENLGASGDVTVSVDGSPSTVTPGQSTTVSAGDSTPPQVVCGTAPTFIIGQPAASVSATVTDSESGPAATTVSAAANTAQVGTFTANVTGYDNAGNTSSVACSYSVTYLFQGFSAPIDNLPTVNSAKAGQAIPIKWRVTNFQGVGVGDPASFVSVTSASASCSLAAPFDAVETYAGNSGLQYLGNGWWQFNWKTPKSYAGLCRSMSLNLTDGIARTAAFTFK
jgi:probable HAF family extracellular repeat protein